MKIVCTCPHCGATLEVRPAEVQEVTYAQAAVLREGWRGHMETKGALRIEARDKPTQEHK